MRRGDGKRKPQIFLNRVSVVPIPFLSGGLLKRARERGRGRPNGAIKGNEEMAAAGLGLPPPFLPPVAKASAYPGDTFNPSAGRFLSPLSLSLPPLKRACYVLSHLSE